VRLLILFICCAVTLLQPGVRGGSWLDASASGLGAAPANRGVKLGDDEGEIETRYDGFADETIVTLKKMRVTCSGGKGMKSTVKNTCISLEASLHCAGLQLGKVRYVQFRFIFESKDWDQRHALDERALVIVADNERISLGNMKLASQGVTTSQLVDVMREVLEATFPYKTFDRIAQAQIVEVKVGPSTFELRDKNVLALKDLNNRVKF
jgi:hypothetical protein